MRKRIRKSVKPDPIRLVLRELEKREAPSESLSILGAHMYFGAAAQSLPSLSARTAPLPAPSSQAALADANLDARAMTWSIALPAAQDEAAQPAAALSSESQSATAAAAWADPWGGWVDGEFPGPASHPAPYAPPADSSHTGGGGGGGNVAAAPASTTIHPQPAAASGGMVATPSQNSPGAPGSTAAPAADGKAQASARTADGADGGGSGSPFPWANRPSSGGAAPTITFGPGTTVFTPATLTHPSYVIDANKGAVLTEAVVNNDFSNWPEDLRAQVSGATVGTYTWDTTGATDATSVTGASTYQLQFTWGSFTSAARTDAITLTEDFVGGGSQSQTFHFVVTATDSPAWSAPPTVVSSGTTVVTPDLLQSGAMSVSNPHDSITLADGSVSTEIDLPAYNPSVPALSLVYNSLAADPRPIFDTRYQLDPTVAVPSTISARLTVDSTPLTTVTYDTSTMNPGDFVQVGLQDATVGLSTGRHTYSVVITANYGTPVTTTNSGSFTVINDGSSPFGAGWWVAGLDRIVTGSGGLALVEAGGMSLWFAGSGGTYTSPAGDFSTLVQNYGGTWTRTLPDGSVEQFDTSGNETSVADANGNTTTYTYSSGVLSTVTDPYGQVSTFAYLSGKLASITDPAGRTTDVTVSSGDLTAATDPAGGAWAYAYDAAGRLTGITDPDNFTTTLAYDSTAHRASTISEADGGTETVSPAQLQGLNTGGTTTAVLTAAAVATYEDGNSQTTTYQLDWNGYGQNMQTTDPVGDVTVQYRYGDGLLWVDSDGLGRRNVYHYGSDGAPTPVYDVGQNVSREIYADDTYDDYTYNGLGEVLTYTNPISETSTYTYNADGDQLTAIDPLGNTTTMAYDGRGNLIQTISPTALTPSGEVRANTYTTNPETTPKVATDADGDYVVVWQAFQEVGTSYDIYAQRYNAYGTALGSEFRVNTYTATTQKSAAVAMDAAGDFVVAWESEAQDGSGYGIYAQRYNAAGAAQGSAFLVNTFTTNDQVSPTVAMDAAGDFVVAWQSYGQGGAAYGIYARRYNSSGAAQGSEFKVNTYTTGWQGAPTVAMDATGDFVVTWTGIGTGDPSYGIFAQRYNSSGMAQGSEFLVNTYTTNGQDYSSVAMDATGDFVIAWESGGQDGSGYGVCAQRYNSSGMAQGEFPVNTYTTGDQTLPAVAMDAAGNFAIAWQSTGQDGSGYGVYGQRYAAAGTAIAGEVPLNVYTTGGQGLPAVAMDADGDFVVAWQGQSATDGSGVTARQFRVTALTQYTYDSKSRPTATTDADGNTSQSSYDSAGNVVTTTDQRGNVTTNTYDAMGRVLSTTLPAPSANPVWNYAYDGLGQLVSQTDPLGNTTTMAYDGRGNLISTVTPITFSPAAANQANTYTTGAQLASMVASDANGDYVVVWQSNGQDGSGYGIYAQRYNASGQADGPEFRVNTDTNGQQARPTVAMDSAGDFVVAWQSYGEDGGFGYGIYAQRYNAAGVAQGSEFQVSTYTLTNQLRPVAAMDAAGDFVVAWTSDSQDGSNYGVYAQRYNSSGTAQGTAFRVNTYTTGAQFLSSVAMDAAGDFVITWTSGGEDGSGYGVYAQRYNSSGTAQGSQFPVNTYTTGNQLAPAVAMDAAGDFVITWESASQDGSGYGIYAQRYNSSGTSQGSEFPVNTYTTGNQARPVVAMDAVGDFVVAWTSTGQDGSGYGVYAQRYAANGSTRGSECPLNAYTTGNQQTPAIAMDADGDMVAAWQGQSATDTSGVMVEQLRVTAVANNAYDFDGNLKTETDPLGNTTTMSYDNADRETEIDGPAGQVTKYAYDSAGELVTSSLLSELVPGLPGADYEVTTYTYEPRGQVATESDANGDATTYTYSGSTALSEVQTTDGLGNAVTETITHDANDRMITDTVNSETTTYTYDPAGNVATVTDANNNTTTYAYDALGQLTSTTDAAGDITLQTYDADGDLNTSTDPDGNTTTYTYDAQDRLTTTKDPLGNVTTVTYDLDGRQQTLTDADNNTTTYAYDVAGNLVTTTDPSSHTTTMTYNAAGELTSSIDRDGRLIDYTYDAVGRELTETWKPTATTTTIDNVVTYTYGLDGQMTSAQDYNSTYNYSYGPTTGLLEKVDDAGTPGLPQVTLTYALSGLGVTESVQDSMGGEVDYAYNGALQMTNAGLSVGGTAGAQVSMSYDAGGRLSTLDRQDGTTTYTLDTTYGYDSADRITSIDNVSRTTAVTTMSQFTYAYDQASRVVGYTGPEGGRAYAYDNDGELTSVTNTGTSTVLESFAYDATGNRTSADGVSYGSPGPGNELTSDGVYSYTYDNEGNMLTKSKSGQLWQYSYDEKNQLIEAKELTGVGGSVLYDAKYTYDVFGRRIDIVENGTTTLETLYDGDNAYMDFNGSGTLTMRYLNGAGMDQRYAREDASGNVAWYITDNVGSVRELAETNGTVLDTITYSAFGTPTDSNAGAGDRFKFTGREWDAGTGQYYYRARYYGPDVGQFTSQDPMGFAAGDTNVYRYVGDSPSNGNDPSGLAPPGKPQPTVPPKLQPPAQPAPSPFPKVEDTPPTYNPPLPPPGIVYPGGTWPGPGRPPWLYPRYNPPMIPPGNLPPPGIVYPGGMWPGPGRPPWLYPRYNPPMIPPGVPPGSLPPPGIVYPGGTWPGPGRPPWLYPRYSPPGTAPKPPPGGITVIITPA